jgi:hypothetical protein
MSRNDAIKELNAELKDLMKRYLDVFEVSSLKISSNITKGIHEIKIEVAEHYRA